MFAADADAIADDVLSLYVYLYNKKVFQFYYAHTHTYTHTRRARATYYPSSAATSAAAAPSFPASKAVLFGWIPVYLELERR